MKFRLLIHIPQWFNSKFNTKKKTSSTQYEHMSIYDYIPQIFSKLIYSNVLMQLYVMILVMLIGFASSHHWTNATMYARSRKTYNDYNLIEQLQLM